MAGQSESLLTGGAGFSRAPSPGNANAAIVGSTAGAHIGVIGLVVVAVAILLILDNLGFRFAVTAGKR